MRCEMKKTMSIIVLLITFSVFLAQPVYANLPDGFWPLLSVYTSALESGEENSILTAGDQYLEFLAAYPRTIEIAENQYNVLFKRLDLQLYEKRSDWDRAIANTNELMEVCEYLQENGVDRSDVILRCRNHLILLEPFAGVYIASYTQKNQYGSNITSSSGTYYGSNDEGSYADRSICSFYVELETETAKKYSSAISSRDNGEQVILINLNFLYESATVRDIPSGKYDRNISETLDYLKTLKSPVLLRVGGEMDLWSKPDEFISAYTYIAKKARALAPEIELVWSPNCLSRWNTDIEDFYPNGNYVDWVGTSLYYNYEGKSKSDDITAMESTMTKQFADPVTIASKVMKIAEKHGKPAIITESGVDRSNGADYAAVKAAKEFSTLTMVYPQVKAIVYFDKKMGESDYRISVEMKSAIDNAIKANPTLLKSFGSTSATYIPIEKFNEQVTDHHILLGAVGRTYLSSDMSAVWKLDGKDAAKTSGSPNHFELDVSALSYGQHNLDVVLSDYSGYTIEKHYVLTRTGENIWSFSQGTNSQKDKPSQPLVYTDEYIYNDAPDSEEALVLDTQALDHVIDIASASSAVSNQIDKMEQSQKSVPACVDLVTLYSETAAARAASRTVSGNDVLINRAMIGGVEQISTAAVLAVENALAEGGVTTARELFKIVTLTTEETGKLTIRIAPDILESDLDRVCVETPTYALTFLLSDLAEYLADGVFTFTSEDIGSGFRPGGVNGKTTVNIEIPDTGTGSPTIIVSLPKDKGNTTYQAVVKTSGEASSSKYNPATGAMDGRINNSGSYTVKTNEKDFSDIGKKSAEMQKAIRYLASKGIIGGTSETTFSPDGTISRAEIAALIVRSLGKLNSAAKPTFSDVTAKNWYYATAASSQKAGLINGYEDNTFRGGIPINKEQIVAVSARVLKTEMGYKAPSNPSSYLSKYSDTVVGWAQPEVALATKENLVAYRKDGTFSGAKNMTRGDAAVIIYRLFQRIW